jgi:hypothetical protein
MIFSSSHSSRCPHLVGGSAGSDEVGRVRPLGCGYFSSNNVRQPALNPRPRAVRSRASQPWGFPSLVGGLEGGG